MWVLVHEGHSKDRANRSHFLELPRPFAQVEPLDAVAELAVREAKCLSGIAYVAAVAPESAPHHAALEFLDAGAVVAFVGLRHCHILPSAAQDGQFLSLAARSKEWPGRRIST